MYWSVSVGRYDHYPDERLCSLQQRTDVSRGQPSERPARAPLLLTCVPWLHRRLVPSSSKTSAHSSSLPRSSSSPAATATVREGPYPMEPTTRSPTGALLSQRLPPSTPSPSPSTAYPTPPWASCPRCCTPPSRPSSRSSFDRVSPPPPLARPKVGAGGTIHVTVDQAVLRLCGFQTVPFDRHGPTVMTLTVLHASGHRPVSGQLHLLGPGAHELGVGDRECTRREYLARDIQVRKKRRGEVDCERVL